jgi:hypothetical protein
MLFASRNTPKLFAKYSEYRSTSNIQKSSFPLERQYLTELLGYN